MGKKGTGKGLQNEKAILQDLKERVGDQRAYYILWKYAPQLLPSKDVNTFADLRATYVTMRSDTFTEAFCENWLLEKRCQTAVKMLLGRLHQSNMIELYERFCNQAMDGDVQAFKAVKSIGDDLFKESAESNIMSLIKNADIETDNESDGD